MDKSKELLLNKHIEFIATYGKTHDVFVIIKQISNQIIYA